MPPCSTACGGASSATRRPGTLPGGRTEALRRLHDYDLAAYGRTRNHLGGTVSHLSPYLRHGMLSAVEVRDHPRSRFPNDTTRLEEFLRQLAWRDFFEKVLVWHGRGLDDDLEEPKHAVGRSARIPLDVVKGDTGLPCVDGMLHELFADGYLHNHARLWFAAYLCHSRGGAVAGGGPNSSASTYTSAISPATRVAGSGSRAPSPASRTS